MKMSLKRNLSIFLVLIMIATLLPVTGQAGFFSNISNQIKAKTNFFSEIGNKINNTIKVLQPKPSDNKATANTKGISNLATGLSAVLNLATNIKNMVNTITDTFKKILGINTGDIRITEQPKDKNNVLPGNMISISAKAKGDHLTYQWYYKRESDGAFVKWDGKTQSTITFKAGENDDGMIVYCEITDKNGRKTRTGQSRIGLVGGKQKDPGAGILINGEESEKYTVSAGQGAELTLKAGNEDIAVKKWYLKGPDGKWIPIGSNTTMSITWEEIKQYYPDWDGKKALNVEFSCTTNDDQHLATRVAFSKAPRESGYYTQQKSTRLKRCTIAEPETNDYSSGDPVYIFFPGTAEMDSARKVVGFEKKYKLYNNVDANIVSVATKCGSGSFSPKDWQTVAVNVADYIEEKYKESPFPIRIDTVSYGGRGGVYLAQILQERGIPVDQLNLGDSCGPMSSYTIKVEDLTTIAGNGTEINIVASDRSSAWSKGTRKMIEDTNNVENINGYIVHGSHGEALGMGIHDYGIHDD